MGALAQRSPIEDRFWGKVKKGGPDECWPWVGARRSQGYGIVEVDGRTARAHRVSYELATGPIPEGRMILHHCDNPPCCNPAHLYAGTHAENMADMKQRGRANGGVRIVGENHPRAILTAEKVWEMRDRHGKGITQKQIAKDMGVSHSLVNNVILGRSWTHV